MHGSAHGSRSCINAPFLWNTQNKRFTGSSILIVIRDVTSSEVLMTQSPKGLALVKQKLVSELNHSIVFNEVNSKSDNEASEFQYYRLFSLRLTAIHIGVLCLIKKLNVC